MKDLWQDSKTISIVFFFWRLGLVCIEYISSFLFPLHPGFLGATHWGNFDGVHYISIANHGYFQYEQAFFPLYPLLIRVLSALTNPTVVALVISHLCYFLTLLFMYRWLKRLNKRAALWSVVFLSAFPASFFFAAAYTESLFLLCSVGSIYAASRGRWITASVLGMFASATRLFGILLFPVLLLDYWDTHKGKNVFPRILILVLVPLGLIAYMVYLQKLVGDPLFFIHAQPAYGAGRSGSAIILLPQVIWRYAKILFTASPVTREYLVAVFELVIFAVFSLLVWLGWRQRIPKKYLLYSASILVLPTLSGTLSSMPRYVLSAFPLFFVLGSMHNTAIKICLLIICLVGLILCASAFLQGYFIS